ncbi:MAG: ABC transporter ATP-binding protein [Lachnospiraceae bacterium]|nr:ABC transporter ATP-binding protein [Lachnospiraceae bacterium]
MECRGLSAGYRRKEVLHGIDWTLETGKMTAIVGPNGSGKSTLLKAMMGQAEIRSGEILLDGKRIQDWDSRNLAKKIAYLPQNRSESRLPAERMVLHGRFPYRSASGHYTKEDEERAAMALSRMGMEHLCHKPVSELSGGERQKVYLAMALAQDAPVLLLDEPAVFLDLSWQLELMELLEELVREGKTVAAVLHDLNHALQYADRLLVMEGGRVRAYGTRKQILESGILEQVFGLDISEVRDGKGRLQYCFSRASVSEGAGERNS